jgi:hypothetical protein
MPVNTITSTLETPIVELVKRVQEKIGTRKKKYPVIFRVLEEAGIEDVKKRWEMAGKIFTLIVPDSNDLAHLVGHIPPRKSQKISSEKRDRADQRHSAVLRSCGERDD